MSLSNYHPKGIAKSILPIMFCTFLFLPNAITACTTVSAIARNGHVWMANNEDGPFGVANFINVYPRTGTDRYGYYTLSYISPRYGEGASMQGGTNEAGLSFDFNAIPYVEDFDPRSRKPYPQGNHAILSHLLGNMESVQEVISFFETYWFVDGFRDAQMHVSDREGSFAIISASGTELVDKGRSLVSTNFDICGKGDGSGCWRYPIAVEKLSTYGAGLKTMEAICRETAQKNGGTMYSNIQDLTTGDVWFFSKHDPGTMLRTNISEMLSKGQRSYTFSDLNSLKEQRPVREWKPSEKVGPAQSVAGDYLGTYNHSYIGAVNVKRSGDGIKVSFSDGTKEILYSSAEGMFSLPDYDLYIKFGTDTASGTPELSLYENGQWSFTVQKAEAVERHNDTKK
ncbi:hypothetical protein LCGC14_1207550 [marine sediment metagenome]|uniref:Uncharacterized protein n=2 Tax=root TaxID=1 RepID=A0A831QRJ1_9FLAO|nr:hypothetical protein [Pricia antarctica]